MHAWQISLQQVDISNARHQIALFSLELTVIPSIVLQYKMIFCSNNLLHSVLFEQFFIKISVDDWVVTYPFVIPDKKMNKDYSTVFLFIGYNLINVGSEYKYF